MHPPSLIEEYLLENAEEWSFQEHGELGVMGTTVEIQFTDGSRIDFYVTARTEMTAEIVPARKKPQPVTRGKSRAATA